MILQPVRMRGGMERGFRMHCPDNISGEEYVALVAAAAMLLSRGLNDFETFALAEFLQSVSTQLFTLGAFKAFEQSKVPPPPPPE